MILSDFAFSRSGSFSRAISMSGGSGRSDSQIIDNEEDGQDSRDYEALSNIWERVRVGSGDESHS